MKITQKYCFSDDFVVTFIKKSAVYPTDVHFNINWCFKPYANTGVSCLPATLQDPSVWEGLHLAIIGLKLVSVTLVLCSPNNNLSKSHLKFMKNLNRNSGIWRVIVRLENDWHSTCDAFWPLVASHVVATYS